jgi:prophage maintenance system killer protein
VQHRLKSSRVRRSLALFLRRNGLRLEATRDEVVQMIRAVAAGDRGEEELARWVGDDAEPR